MTLIFAKFGTELINIYKVTSRKTRWPHFSAYRVDAPIIFKQTTPQNSAEDISYSARTIEIKLK